MILDNEIEHEEKFKEWLITLNFSTRVISGYPSTLKKSIPQKLKEINELEYNNLFQCFNIEYLKTLQKRLRKGGDLSQFNQSISNGMPNAAVGQYIKYLLETENLNNKIELNNHRL